MMRLSRCIAVGIYQNQVTIDPLIEFVPKEDPTSQFMLSLKGDIFPDYTEENFKNEMSKIVKIKNITTISDTKRRMYEFIPL